MRVSIVIPAHNEEYVLGSCLEAVCKAVEGRDNVEVIVVDNASIDRTSEVASAFPGVRVVLEPKKGLSQARQAGFLASTGELVANVDADTRMTQTWISQVIQEFSRDPKLVALSGPFIFYDLSRRMNLVVRAYYVAGYAQYLVHRFILRIGSLIQGGNFVVRRTALEQIGGFNTALSFYGEDSYLAKRLNRVGKVKFTFRLPLFASGRRIVEEGAFTMALRYLINHWWIFLFNKAFTKSSLDVRIKQRQRFLPYRPLRRWREALLFSAVFVFLFAAAYSTMKNTWLFRGTVDNVANAVVVQKVHAETVEFRQELHAFSERLIR